MPVAGTFHQTLKDTALAYLALGWSVIPLWGDLRPDRPKVAAVSWESFQRRRASEAELTVWFERQGFTGLGIVTGAVSQLVILDFDDPALYRTFANACADLLQTRSVRTRRGQHLYFHLPPHLTIRSRKLDGIDLLAGGCYAVAQPSVIDGFEYRVERGGQPRRLTQADLNRIDTFLDQTAITPSKSRLSTPAIPPGETQTEAATPDSEAFPVANAPVDMFPEASFTAETLRLLYQGLAHRFKRNVALFKASCLARDHGWSYAAVVECLADAHVTLPAQGVHRKESEKARYREAIATIRSTYQRPPRRLKQPNLGGLYNSIREKFFQLGQTCVVRVLEGLRLAGFKAGQLVTEKQVLQALRGLVGRRSIQAALKAFSPRNEPVFSKISPHHPPQRSAAPELRIVNTSNAQVRSAKRVKNRGRPSMAFCIPTLETLCKLLGVQPSGSDPLTLDDLQSAARTRQAAHRELIRRRPSLYLKRWLAGRLGVSEATIWRYNQTISALHVVPTFTATPLSWHNLRAIPVEDTLSSGTFLEDDTGKRWPALKGIATRLLGQGRAVKLLIQSLNYYWVGDGDPPAVGMQVERATDRPLTEHHAPILTLAQRIERLVRTFTFRPIETAASALPVSRPQSRNDRPLATVIGYAKQVSPPVKTRQRRFWKPLQPPDAETLAQRVYITVNGRTSTPEHKLSLTTARRWVAQYGEQLVVDGLHQMEARSSVRQPAGFLATLLRSQARHTAR